MNIAIWQIISFSVTFAVSGLALFRGGIPERFVGGFLLVGSIVTYLIADRRWMDVQFAIMWLDIAGFLVLCAVALLADRWWPLWAAGLQGLCVAIHLAFWAQHRVISLTYMTALNIIGYAVFLALAAGTVAHMRRRRLTSAGQGPVSTT